MPSTFWAESTKKKEMYVMMKLENKDKGQILKAQKMRGWTIIWKEQQSRKLALISSSAKRKIAKLGFSEQLSR